MTVPNRQRLRAARGVSLIGLLFWAVIVACVAGLTLKVLPSLNEYTTIQRTINKIASSGATTVPEIRSAFEKQKEIEYSISSISGKDLEVTKENDKVVIGFAYEREVPLFGPVSLLLKFDGRSGTQ